MTIRNNILMKLEQDFDISYPFLLLALTPDGTILSGRMAIFLGKLMRL